MKIAFLIMRSPEYRVYAPVIEAALARGWEVECWHDHSQLETGLKGYQFPRVDSMPEFRNGRPTVKPFQGQPELRQWMAEMRADVVVAWETAEAAAGMPLPEPRPFWVGQQYNLDSLVKYNPESLRSCDLFLFYSRWWLDWAGEYFESEGLVDDGDAFVREMASRSAFVGLPEMDAAQLIDPAEVRRRWGIPPDQPVVVLFVFPQGVGRNGFWPKQICAEPSRLRQLVNIARRGRFEYLPHVWNGWNDLSVVTALRDLCDRSGAYLIIKTRRKTPVPSYARAVADQCIDDESVYPATVLETLSIASLSIGYYSTTVFESVSLGVPHVSLTYDGTDYAGYDPGGYFPRFFSPAEGGVFQFSGVTTAWSIPEALRRLPKRSIADFAMEPRAQAQYLHTFLDADGGPGGARAIDAIERAMSREPVTR